MADNITARNATSDVITIATSESGGVHTPRHTISAGTAAIGTVDIKPVQTISRAAISAASSGDNTLVAAAVGLKTKVIGLMLVAAGSVVARLEDGAGGTALTGQMTLATGTPVILPVVPQGYHYFETTANTLLNLELGGAVQVSGWLLYYQEA